MNGRKLFNRKGQIREILVSIFRVLFNFSKTVLKGYIHLFCFNLEFS